MWLIEKIRFSLSRGTHRRLKAHPQPDEQLAADPEQPRPIELW